MVERESPRWIGRVLRFVWIIFGENRLQRPPSRRVRGRGLAGCCAQSEPCQDRLPQGRLKGGGGWSVGCLFFVTNGQNENWIYHRLPHAVAWRGRGWGVTDTQRAATVSLDWWRNQDLSVWLRLLLVRWMGTWMMCRSAGMADWLTDWWRFKVASGCRVIAETNCDQSWTPTLFSAPPVINCYDSGPAS